MKRLLLLVILTAFTGSAFAAGKPASSLPQDLLQGLAKDLKATRTADTAEPDFSQVTAFQALSAMYAKSSLPEISEMLRHGRPLLAHKANNESSDIAVEIYKISDDDLLGTRIAADIGPIPFATNYFVIRGSALEKADGKACFKNRHLRVYVGKYRDYIIGVSPKPAVDYNGLTLYEPFAFYYKIGAK